MRCTSINFRSNDSRSSGFLSHIISHSREEPRHVTSPQGTSSRSRRKRESRPFSREKKERKPYSRKKWGTEIKQEINNSHLDVPPCATPPYPLKYTTKRCRLVSRMDRLDNNALKGIMTQNINTDISPKQGCGKLLYPTRESSIVVDRQKKWKINAEEHDHVMLDHDKSGACSGTGHDEVQLRTRGQVGGGAVGISRCRPNQLRDKRYRHSHINDALLCAPMNRSSGCC